MTGKGGGPTPIDSAAWMANDRMRVFSFGGPGKLLIKFLLWNGNSINWVAEVLVLLKDLIGCVWGFNYCDEAPITATRPMWQQWRQQGYQVMMEEVLSQLKGSEFPPSFRSWRASEYSGGDSPVGKLFFYPSRLYRTLSLAIKRAKAGWKPKIVLSPWCETKPELD